jgi:hypothetical protein
MEWCREAELTAIALKKEHPDWDEETLIYETMDCIEMDLMEELSFTERHLRKFLRTKITNDSKKRTQNENQ